MLDDVGAELEGFVLQVRRRRVGRVERAAGGRHLAVEPRVLILVDLPKVPVELVYTDRPPSDLGVPVVPRERRHWGDDRRYARGVAPASPPAPPIRLT